MQVVLRSTGVLLILPSILAIIYTDSPNYSAFSQFPGPELGTNEQGFFPPSLERRGLSGY